ncbi:MAG: hypothetical protein V3U70_02265 [Thermoplasmata archaeon]
MIGQTRLEELEEELRSIEDELVDVFPSPRADILIDAWTRKVDEADRVADEDEWVGPESPRLENGGRTITLLHVTPAHPRFSPTALDIDEWEVILGDLHIRLILPGLLRVD